MTVDAVLSQCAMVRETGPGKFIARCPCHDDRSPSLAIRECDDGRVLLHCFAGCETEDVLAALGLSFPDVMPERIGEDQSYKPLRQRFDARQVLAILDHEAMVTAIIAADFLEHKELDEETWQRLVRAVNRINSARAQAAPLKFKNWQGSQQPASITAQRKEAA